jgi:hypothetical protein
MAAPGHDRAGAIAPSSAAVSTDQIRSVALVVELPHARQVEDDIVIDLVINEPGDLVDPATRAGIPSCGPGIGIGES